MFRHVSAGILKASCWRTAGNVLHIYELQFGRKTGPVFWKFFGDYKNWGLWIRETVQLAAGG